MMDMIDIAAAVARAIDHVERLKAYNGTEDQGYVEPNADDALEILRGLYDQLWRCTPGIPAIVWTQPK